MGLWDMFCGRTNPAGIRQENWAGAVAVSSALRQAGNSGEPVRCGTKVRFNWQWGEGAHAREITDGVVVKVSTEENANPDAIGCSGHSSLRFPFYRVHLADGTGVYINREDVISVLDQNQAISVMKENGSMTAYSPERVSGFLNSLIGR